MRVHVPRPLPKLGNATRPRRCGESVFARRSPDARYRLPDELEELLDRELDEELPPDELLDDEDCDELDDDELDDDELDEDELEAVLDDELEEELLAVLELEALLVDELLDEEPAVLLDEDELLAVPDEEDDELGAGELDELVPPVELLELDTGSGAVGVVVQPTMPAASAAAGAPDSSSRKSRRRVRSETSLGAGACGRDESDM